MALAPIRMLDATHLGWTDHGAAQVDQCYAAIDAKSSMFSAIVPVSGIVRGYICPTCARITLYGEPVSTR